MSRPRWLGSETIAVALITAVLGGAVGGYTAWIGAVGKDRELDIKLIEVGIAILRADPKDENTAKIRRWAIEVVEKNSRMPFSEEEKAELLNRAIKGTFAYTYEPGFASGDWPANDGRTDRKDHAPVTPSK